MRSTGKQPIKPIKPSPNPGILPIESDQPLADQEPGEGSDSGTHDYQAGVTAFLETTDVEKDARDAAPDDLDEARQMEHAEGKGRKPRIKTQRPSKE